MPKYICSGCSAPHATDNEDCKVCGADKSKILSSNPTACQDNPTFQANSRPKEEEVVKHDEDMRNPNLADNDEDPQAFQSYTVRPKSCNGSISNASMAGSSAARSTQDMSISSGSGTKNGSVHTSMSILST
uniref:Uncharacterized protein n=1 Tax=Melanopsichium pennsylvanicum 4 TaxID=1398559 RepID=A0A077R9V7_9BASI|nr:uncharacterized protein BN887_03598 [Melanopsichium pennsylvanicum 4]